MEGLAITIQNIASLLEVQRSDPDLRLRIDLDTKHTGQHDPEPILELTFSAPKDLEAWFETLREAEGKTIEFELFPRGAQLTIDYAGEYEEIECEAVAQSRHPYSPADLLTKSKHKVLQLELAQEAYWKIDGELQRLRRELLRVAESEMDRARRRFEFFERQSSPRAEHARGKIEAFERVLRTLRRRDEP